MAAQTQFLTICRAGCLIAALGVLSACGSALPIFVGEQRAGQDRSAPPMPAPSANPNLGAAAGMSPIASMYRANVAPPTIQADPRTLQAQDTAPVAEAPRAPLVVMPLSNDPGALTKLATAARDADTAHDAKFILMLLSTAASSTDGLAKNNADAQAAADGAIKAFVQSGIAADRVSVSALTNPNLTQGEIRLYHR